MGQVLCTSAGQKVSNGKVRGLGGELRSCGRVVAVIVAFDYEGYPAEEICGCGPLTCTPDGTRFAKLARASGAEVHELYDKQIGNSEGFPRRAQVLAKMTQIGHQLGPGDTFVFFFAGHGSQSEEPGGIEEDDGIDEELCFVTPEGNYDPLRDNDIADLLLNQFSPDTQILFVTDCCHSATMCDLSREEFGDRPICHLAACKDESEGIDLGDGGALTSSLMEVIERMVADGETEFRVTDVYNKTYETFSGSDLAADYTKDRYAFSFERTPNMDPDEFPWPFVPPPGWTCDTLLD